MLSTNLSLTGLYNLTEPSSTSFLFSEICPGDTAHMCSLAWNSAARICDKYNFLELAYTIWPEPTSTSLLFTAILQRLWRHCANVKSRLILWCSFMRYVPNSHELAYKKWVRSGSTTITHFRSTHSTVRSSHRLLTSRKTVKVRHWAPTIRWEEH